MLIVRCQILGEKWKAGGVLRRFAPKMSGMIMSVRRCPTSMSEVKIRCVTSRLTRTI